MSKRVFSFNYVLKGTAGEVLDASEPGQPLAFLEGAQQIIPGLELQILNLKEGDKKLIKVAAQEAYGLPDETAIVSVPKTDLGHIPLEIGTHLQAHMGNEVRVFKVIEIGATEVKLDGNHPLAGQDLEFDVEIVEVREATVDEVLHGHAHGAGGHHH